MTTQTADARPILGLKTGWGWYLVAGILFIIVGVLAVIEPIFTSLAVGVYLGVSFIVAGAMATAGGIANVKHKGAWVFIILGILAMIAGGYMLMLPFNAAVSLVWVIGVWMVVAGGFEFATAFQIRRNRGWMILIGIVDVILGGYLMWVNPLLAMAFLGWFVGLTFAMRGVASIVLSGELRKLSQL